jgi:hypothetical protein
MANLKYDKGITAPINEAKRLLEADQSCAAPGDRIPNYSSPIWRLPSQHLTATASNLEARLAWSCNARQFRD